jgi:hypothetical protein
MPNCPTQAAPTLEVWNERGELAGGGYGVAIGGAFVTESQFSREPNTSKIGFTVLNWHLAHWGFAFTTAKLMTPTTTISFQKFRSEYPKRLAQAGRQPVGRVASRGGFGNGCGWQPSSSSLAGVFHHGPSSGISDIHADARTAALIRRRPRLAAQNRERAMGDPHPCWRAGGVTAIVGRNAGAGGWTTGTGAAAVGAGTVSCAPVGGRRRVRCR